MSKNNNSQTTTDKTKPVSPNMEKPDGEYYFEYFDDDTREQMREPACPECLKFYSWKSEHKAVIQKAIKYHEIAVDCINPETGEPVSKDLQSPYYRSPEYFEEYCKIIDNSKGPYDGFAAKIREIQGILEYAWILGILNKQEQLIASDTIDLIKDYKYHLKISHYGQPWSMLNTKIIEVLTEPKYMMGFDKELSRYIACMIGGLPLDEAKKALRKASPPERLKDMIIRPGKRTDRMEILRTALWNAVSVLQRLLRASKHDRDEIILVLPTQRIVQQIHEQLFLIDELISMGCMDRYKRTSTVLGRRLRSVVLAIKALIDWDQCPNLKNLINP